MSRATPFSIVSFLLVIVLVTLLPPPVAAQWKPNGAPVRATLGDCLELGVVPDGAGGMYACWGDTRNAATNVEDIYLQHIDAFGYPMWTVNGIAPNAGPSIQYGPTVAEDGSGGVFLVWTQGSPPEIDVYAQHYDESGNAQWTPGGIPVCTATNFQQDPVAVADGAGGVWISWTDYRYGGSDTDIFINRIDVGGSLYFTTSGLSICASSGNQSDVRITSDGLGGMIAAWTDYRGGATSDIYAQRVDGNNGILWDPNGALVTGAAYHQFMENIAADGYGGAILVWRDGRKADAELDIFAQRIDGAGDAMWQSDGTAICEASDNQLDACLAADGAGGAVIAWRDDRLPGSQRIYADYIDANGATQWYGDGKLVAGIDGFQENTPSITSVGDGVVISWRDDYLGSYDVHAQRYTWDGTEMWGVSGVQVSAGSTTYDGLLVPDMTGGAIVTWIDDRNGRQDVFAQRLEPAHGEWGRPEPTVSSANDNPGDQGGYVELNWYASDRDRQPYSLISHYSTWRATDSGFFVAGKGLDAAAAAQAAWPGATIVDGPGAIAADFDGEAIWVEDGPQGVPMFWEWMSNQTAYYQPGYSYLMPTRADSSGAGPATHYFKVIAHSWDQYTFWESQYVSGYSVDNLAPGAPLMLSAVRVGNYVRLDWNPSGLEETDFSDYAVYRATSAGVTPVPLYYLDVTEETTLWDQNAPAGTPYYYIVIARDVHGNQSPPSNEANVDGTVTGVGDDAPPLTTLRVMPNAPNPFGDATTLRIGLPESSDMVVNVYDVAGRRVATRNYAAETPGWHDIRFDGRDDAGHMLPGGVYFCRVCASGTTVTRKMVIAR